LIANGAWGGIGPCLSKTNNFKTWCEDAENGREYLLLEWDYTNNEKKPEDVTRGSREKVWWRCRKCEEGWKAVVQDRTKSKNPTGCPACNPPGIVATPDNNLEVWCGWNGREDLLEEWAHASMSPKDFTYSSHEKGPWRCGKCQGEWETLIFNRTRSKTLTGCPLCSGNDRQGSGAGYEVEDLVLCASSGDLDPGNPDWRDGRQLTLVRAHERQLFLLQFSYLLCPR
jgi:hypothetical protein